MACRPFVVHGLTGKFQMMRVSAHLLSASAQLQHLAERQWPRTQGDHVHPQPLEPSPGWI